MKCDSKLMKILEGKEIVWHPAPLVNGDGCEFLDLLLDEDGFPDRIHIYTDERIYRAEENYPYDWKLGMHDVAAQTSPISNYLVEDRRKICDLDFDSRLAMESNSRKSSNKVFSAKVTLFLKDGRTITRKVLLATAESIEFGLKVFLENGIMVRTVFMTCYHITYNALTVEGRNVVLMLKGLGTERLFADDCSIVGTDPENISKVLSAYPALHRYYQDCNFGEVKLWMNVGCTSIRECEVR